MREAVLAADTDRCVDACPAARSRDVVVLAPGARYELDQGGLRIASVVVLQGRGAVLAVATGAPDRYTAPLLHVAATGRVRLTDLALTGSGSTALLNDGVLVLRDVAVRGNEQGLDAGPGTAAGLTNRGRASARRSTFADNQAPSGPAAISNARGARLRLVHSTVSGNDGTFGPVPAVGNAGVLALHRTVVRDNDAGLVNEGTLVATRSALRRTATTALLNHGHARLALVDLQANGLAVDNRGDLDVAYCWVRDGSGLRSDRGAGGMENSGDLRLRGSAVTGNSGGAAGGIRSSGNLELRDVTVAENRAGGFLDTSGDTSSNPDGAGGVSVVGGTAQLSGVTLARNAYETLPELPTPATVSGGLARLGGSLTVSGSVIAENRSDRPVAAGGPDCTGEVRSLGHTLVQRTAGCAYAPGPGDLVRQDPRLGPLGRHGGPTLTLLPLDGSPLVDRGSPAPPGSGLPGACTA
ncbi:MAG: hypothetical protein M3P46_06930 [Actinomycetota bacterium]|nr:hypothetical protein [Actinomycetota bacterium]